MGKEIIANGYVHCISVEKAFEREVLSIRLECMVQQLGDDDDVRLTEMTLVFEDVHAVTAYENVRSGSPIHITLEF